MLNLFKNAFFGEILILCTLKLSTSTFIPRMQDNFHKIKCEKSGSGLLSKSKAILQASALTTALCLRQLHICNAKHLLPSLSPSVKTLIACIYHTSTASASFIIQVLTISHKSLYNLLPSYLQCSICCSQSNVHSVDLRPSTEPGLLNQRLL